MTTIPVSEARAALPALVDRVLAGEEVTLTRHGEPVVVLVRPDALRVRRADAALADAERIRAMLERARSTPLRARPGVSPGRAAELLAEVERSRSARPARGS